MRIRIMIACLEGQVEHGQDEEHLGKVAGRIDEVAGKEGLAGLDGSVIAPESIDFDEGSVRLFLGNAVVIVLGPFLGCIELPEELPDLALFFSDAAKYPAVAVVATGLGIPCLAGGAGPAERLSFDFSRSIMLALLYATSRPFFSNERIRTSH